MHYLSGRNNAYENKSTFICGNIDLTSECNDDDPPPPMVIDESNEDNGRSDASVLNRNIYQENVSNIGYENNLQADNPQAINLSSKIPQQNDQSQHPEGYPQQSEIFHQPGKIQNELNLPQHNLNYVQKEEQNAQYQMHQNILPYQQQYLNNFHGCYDQKLPRFMENQYYIPPEQKMFQHDPYQNQVYNQQGHFPSHIYEPQGPGGMYYRPYQPDYQHPVPLNYGRGYYSYEHGHQGFQNVAIGQNPMLNNPSIYQVVLHNIVIIIFYKSNRIYYCVCTKRYRII